MNLEKPDDPRIPYPSVHFGPGFVERVERVALSLNAARERSEGAGASAIAGAGEEFVGYRPYRPGEDLRGLDWNLFARLDAPYVRVTRREAAETWTIVFDTSASMGTGPPGKLQLACELVCALTCLGWKRRARVLVQPSQRANEGAWVGRGPRELNALIDFLSAQRAYGDAGLVQLTSGWAPTRESGRVFFIGDLLDGDATRFRLSTRRGCEVFLIQLLARHELDPGSAGAIEWLDPESRAGVRMALDEDVRRRYRHALAAELEAWGALARRRHMHYSLWCSDRSFEDVLHGALEALE